MVIYCMPEKADSNEATETCSDEQYYVYILECADTSYYTGITNDLDMRISVHNQGKGAKYTRSRLPVHLVHSETFETKSDALKREHQIKKLSRPQKALLIDDST